MRNLSVLLAHGLMVLVCCTGVFHHARAAQATLDECLESPNARCIIDLLLQESPEPSAVLVETLWVVGLYGPARQVAEKLGGPEAAVIDILELAREDKIGEALKLSMEKKTEIGFDASASVAATLARRGRFDEARSAAALISGADARSSAYWLIAYAQIDGGNTEGIGETVRQAIDADEWRDLNLVPLVVALAHRGDFEGAQSVASILPSRQSDFYIRTLKLALRHLAARGETATVEAILRTYESDTSGAWQKHLGAMLGLVAETHAAMQGIDALRIIQKTAGDLFLPQEILPLMVLAGDAKTAIPIALQIEDGESRAIALAALAIAAYAIGDTDALQQLSQEMDRALGSGSPDPANPLAFMSRLKFAAGTGRLQEALRLAESAGTERGAMLASLAVLPAVVAGGDRSQLSELLRYIAHAGGTEDNSRFALQPACDAIADDALKLKFEHNRTVAEALHGTAAAGNEGDSFDRVSIAHACLYFGGDLRGALQMVMAEETSTQRASGLFLLARALLGH
jgi:hypothetical protein